MQLQAAVDLAAVAAIKAAVAVDMKVAGGTNP
jgi:hypothetical protein